MKNPDLAKDRADWLLDAVACATQNRQFLRGEPEYDAVAGEAILLNGEKAINVALAKQAEGDTRDALIKELVAAAKFLWDRLDDIDTLDDSCRDNDGLFRERVRQVQKRRFEVGTTDGYSVTLNAETRKEAGYGAE